MEAPALRGSIFHWRPGGVPSLLLWVLASPQLLAQVLPTAFKREWGLGLRQALGWTGGRAEMTYKLQDSLQNDY